MRATEYLMIVILIGVFVFLNVQGAKEFNEVYSSSNLVNESMFEGYDNTSAVSTQANSVFEKFQALGDSDNSWFQKIGAGIVAIPYAVIMFPIMVATAYSTLAGWITKSLGGVVPYPIIFAILTFFIVEIVRRMMEFFQRSRS